MDARIKNLVDTHSLKMNLWTKAARQHAKPYFYADPRLDVVMVMIVDPRTPKITHFVDEHVALLYEENTREVIGFRIESFEKSFPSPICQPSNGMEIERRKQRFHRCGRLAYFSSSARYSNGK